MNQPTPDVAPFRYYVQMVLPAVYGDELSYYEVLAKVAEKLNEGIVKFVCFGLGDDGHFKAYIPATWQFLQFDTGLNPDDSETYGHLIIKW